MLSLPYPFQSEDYVPTQAEVAAERYYQEIADMARESEIEDDYAEFLEAEQRGETVEETRQFWAGVTRWRTACRHIEQVESEVERAFWGVEECPF